MDDNNNKCYQCTESKKKKRKRNLKLGLYKLIVLSCSFASERVSVND